MNDSQNSLDRIVYRIRRGDEAAFKVLFDQFFSVLKKRARQYLRDEHAAKDIVQEVFLNLWKNRGKLADNVPIRNYLERACINRSLNHLRYQERFFRGMEDDWMLTFEYPIHRTPHCIVSYNELSDAIESCIAGLPDKIRIPFTLSRFEHLTHREISVRTGLSECVVEKCIQMALRRLRQLGF